MHSTLAISQHQDTRDLSVRHAHDTCPMSVQHSNPQCPKCPGGLKWEQRHLA